MESVIKAYHEGEYDFAIDHTIVMNITGYDADEAREMVQLHTKTESGM